MSNVYSEISGFIKELPYWLQSATVKLLKGQQPTEEDVQDAYDWLLIEYQLAQAKEKPSIPVPEIQSNAQENVPRILTSIENVTGVNALATDQKITFSNGLTIVFGANGSGKSGYTRLFKKCFFSRSEEDIIPNVHLTGMSKDIEAKFSFGSSGVVEQILYPLQKNHPAFRQLAVFDSKSVIKHLNQKNQFEFKPSGLKIFSDIVGLVKKIEGLLNRTIEQTNCENSFSSFFDGASAVKTLVEQISHLTSIEQLKMACAIDENEEHDYVQLTKKIDQLTAIEFTREQESSKISKQEKHLAGIVDKLYQRLNTTNEAAINHINDCIENEKIKRQLTTEKSVDQFQHATIKHIGSLEWKEFIASAQKFALRQNDIYPQNGASCLLCQQELKEEGKNLIAKYWQFLKSNAAEELKKAERELGDLEKLYNVSFPLINVAEDILTEWLSKNAFAELKYLQELAEIIEARRLKIHAALIAKNKLQLEGITIDQSIIDSAFAKLNSLKNNIHKDQSEELGKLRIQKQLFDHKKKLKIYLDDIEQLILRLKWKRKASQISFTSVKRKITDFEKHLSEKYYNTKYLDQFSKECKELNGDFGIEVNHSGSSGTSYRQLLIKKYSPAEILSEGEQKVISIADFLSEITISDDRLGVIFDDPVNSLDEERKIIIAERLAKESTQRQVIIFTHDLVFLSALQSYATEHSIALACHWIEKGAKHSGIIYLNNTPSFEKNYKRSGKANEYYQKATSSPPSGREEYVRMGFAALRTSYEALVIFDLFNGVVQRFAERISVDSLKDVVFNEAIRDEVMDGFYSCCQYMEGHLHSDKYSAKKPTIENLRTELDRFTLISKKLKELKAQAKNKNT